MLDRRPRCGKTSSMQSREIQIQYESGVHARPASVFVRAAARFASEVTLKKENSVVNGKSIMGLLTLALAPGACVTLETEGPDEAEAMDELAAILGGQFE